MAELAFLDAVAAFLAAEPLTPAVPAGRIGAVEPFVAADLPAVVLSLVSTGRRRIGLGDRGDLMTGALSVSAAIDLASPFLPGEPGFRLVDATNRVLALPHGGLVRSDGTEGPLSNADLTVSVDGAAQTVVGSVPAAGQVRSDPGTGQLTFGSPLPGVGLVRVRYFVGQWERRVERIAGVLQMDACADTAGAANTLGASALTPLLSPAAPVRIQQLMQISLLALSGVVHRPALSGVVPVAVPHFRRTATFGFEYQHLVDRADSSGGVIQRIPITTRLEVDQVDRATGALIHDIVDVA